MKNICLVTNGALPVPDIKGGAIERLVTLLIEENEHSEKLKITVLACADKEAESFSYQHTQIVPCKVNSKFGKKILWKVRGGLYKLIGHDFCKIHAYERHVNQWLIRNGKQFDLIINEGIAFGCLKDVSHKFGKNKLVLHVHANFHANDITDNIYGTVWGISDFVTKDFMITSHTENINCSTIYNGIDLTRYAEILSPNEIKSIKEKYGVKENDFLLIYCGRIIEEKGVKPLIESVLSIQDSHIKLMVLGSVNFKTDESNEYAEDVKQMVLKYPDRIISTGFIDNKDVYRYMQCSQVGCVPSVWEEGFGLTFLEMMASGLPTIATMSGGLPEIGTEKTTLFVHKDERLIGELREAILRLRDDENLRRHMGGAAKERSKFFSSKVFYSHFVDAVNKIISQND